MTNDLTNDAVHAAPVAWTIDTLLDALRGDAEEHGLQCAYELQQRVPDDVELQVAGLVHDVAHRVSTEAMHGAVGADIVRPLLGDRVASLVKLHVDAKRYLVTVDPEYRSTLSPESVHTLALQGGDMDDAERAAFEAEPDASDALVLRRADEAAKVQGRAVPGLDRWEAILRRVALTR